MEKYLTKKQKETESIRALKSFLKNNVEANILSDLKNILKTANLPQNWYKKDNPLLPLFVFSEFCKKYIEQNCVFSEKTSEEFETLKNQLKK